jgi:biopolymer transport protein ExbD
MDFGRRLKISAEANMSSISDLVFLLLIFFIIMSTMVVNGEQVNLPQTSTGEPTGGNVTLTITKDLRYLVDGDEVGKEGVEIRMKAIMGAKTDKNVVLNVDRDVPTGETIELLGMAKMNGWKVVVATRPKPAGGIEPNP